MTLEELQAALRSRGGRLVLAGDRLRVEAPAGTVPAELLAAVRDDKDALVTQLREHQQECLRLVAEAVDSIARDYVPGGIAALSSQQRTAIRAAESALDAAALAVDVSAARACADAFIDAWREALAERALVLEVLGLTVDEWCARPDKPTIVLDTPNGTVLLVADRGAYTRAVDAGEVVFSPLEVEQLVTGHGDGLVDDRLVRALVETKRTFPGARLEDVYKPREAVAEEQPEPQLSLLEDGDEHAPRGPPAAGSREPNR